MREKDKEKMIKSSWFLALLIGLSILAACGRDPYVDADPLYRAGKYDEAWQIYKKAFAERPESPLLHYNLGVGLYKKGDYQQAVEYFTKALITEDTHLEERANYNIGNCKFRQGEQAERGDLVRAVEFYQEAQDYFQRALELKPIDEDGLYNQQVVQEKIKRLSSLALPQRERKLKNEAAGEKEKGLPFKQEPAPSPSVSAPRDFRQQEIREKIQAAQKRDIQIREGQEGDPIKGTPPVMSRGEAEKLLAEYLLGEETKSGIRDGKRRSVAQGVQKDW